MYVYKAEDSNVEPQIIITNRFYGNSLIVRDKTDKFELIEYKIQNVKENFTINSDFEFGNLEDIGEILNTTSGFTK